MSVAVMSGLSLAQQAGSSSPQQAHPQQQVPAKQTSPAVTPAATPPADDNPFPEDVSRKAAEAAKHPQEVKPEAPTAPATAEPAAAGESSSSGGYKPPEDDAEPETAPAGSERRKLSLRGDGYVGTPHAEKIALRDEEVADLYFKDGNYAGALLRYEDALHYVPDDEAAAIGIAESARRLGKRDKALEAYKNYLQLAPQGKKAKEARKAVEELSAAGKH